jgi:serine/threonine-protein kinase
MGLKEDQLFGRLALSLKLVTPQQLNECLALQRERGAKGLRMPLGVALREKGYLTEAQISEILQKQRGTTRRFQTIGGYLIDRKLGDGPMGIVYRALDQKREGWVALRVLPGRLQREPGVLAEMQRRLEAAKGLAHTNLVAILAVGEAQGFHYVASEWVEGESLASLLEAEPVLDEVRAVRIAYEIAAGLQLLHGRKLVHRALRPENIFIDAKGRARLADFGLLRLDLEERLGPSMTGVLGGTTEYVAPEMAGPDAAVDLRADLYSLGAILFRMTAGRPPFMGATPRETLAKHAQEPIPSLRALRPEVSERLEKVVTRLLAKDPAARHPNPAVLLKDLLLLLPEAEWEKLPKPQSPGGTTMRRRKLLRRRRWIQVAAAAGGLLLLALILWWLLG